MTQTEAGDRIMGTLGSRFDDKGIYRAMGNKIDALFDQARSAPGTDDVLPLSGFATRIGETMDNFEDVIPDVVKSRLAGFVNDRPFTVGEAFKLRQLINARSRSTSDPAQAAGLSAIKRGLDEFLGESAERGVGGEALTLFQQANAASRERATAFGARGLQEVVGDKVAPDDFVRRFIVGGKRDDLLRMRQTLLEEGGERGAAAWETTRRQVLEHLQDNAVNDAGSFSASGYNRTMERIGVDKLRVFFNNDELAQLQRIGRAATDLFTDPPSGGIPVGNKSGTGAMNWSNMPLLRGLSGVANLRQANHALSGSAVDRVSQGSRNQEIANMLTNPMGANPFAIPGGIMGVLAARAAAGGGGGR